MKIGIDFHGVIDVNPEFFSIITKLLVENKHEVHIITGLRKEDFELNPASITIAYTHFYSITYGLRNTSYMVDIHGRPRFDEYLWNTAKAIYCKDNKIDIMIDDTKEYAKYFSTPFLLTERIKWKKNIKY